MAILVLGLDDGQYFELPYTFAESPETDQAARLSLVLFREQIVYKKIEPDRMSSAISSDEDDINLESFERKLVLIALERSAWCQKDAAAMLGISARQMSTKIDRHRINPPIKTAWRKAR